MKPTFGRVAAGVVAAIGIGVAAIASAQEAPMWLDADVPAGWNEAGASIPTAPKLSGAIDPQCRAQARPAELAEDHLVAEQGWLLDGGFQGGWGVVVISATSDYDGMCRPVHFQTFVFVDGVFAGTLSPTPMNSRSDGALNQLFLFQSVDGVEVIADYARYTANDPLCCASRTTSVTFTVDANARVVRPASASTYPN